MYIFRNKIKLLEYVNFESTISSCQLIDCEKYKHNDKKYIFRKHFLYQDKIISFVSILPLKRDFVKIKFLF